MSELSTVLEIFSTKSSAFDAMRVHESNGISAGYPQAVYPCGRDYSERLDALVAGEIMDVEWHLKSLQALPELDLMGIDELICVVRDTGSRDRQIAAYQMAREKMSIDSRRGRRALAEAFHSSGVRLARSEDLFGDCKV